MGPGLGGPTGPAPIYLWEFICPQAWLAHSPLLARGQELLLTAQGFSLPTQAPSTDL